MHIFVPNGIDWSFMTLSQDGRCSNIYPASVVDFPCQQKCPVFSFFVQTVNRAVTGPTGQSRARNCTTQSAHPARRRAREGTNSSYLLAPQKPTLTAIVSTRRGEPAAWPHTAGIRRDGCGLSREGCHGSCAGNNLSP